MARAPQGATSRVYSALSAWHQEYGDKLQIILYPSDEFGGQELPSEKVPAFVESKGLPTSGGACTLMSKVNVNGAAADEVWKFLKTAYPGEVRWNFAGIFVVDKTGAPIGRFTSQQLEDVGAAIEKALAA